ncbi:MAG: carbon monoxide dehydrogenase subunit G [Anaerolineae bacterium]|nr:carbon monoxide dehydrogenase subunit G [Anaerolineae bacterium]
MDISGDFTFDFPRHLVWNLLQDPAVLETVLPSGRNFAEVGQNEYSGEMVIKIGPVQGTFQGKIQLSNFNAPESYWIEVNGGGATGVVNASGRLHLEARGGQTYMTYAGQANIGGRIASVGQRLLDNAARIVIRQSLEALHEYMKTQTEVSSIQSSAVPSVSTIPTPPLQTTKIEQSTPPISSPFQVMRHYLDRFIPVQYHVWILGAIVITIVFVILLMTSR